MLISEPPRVSAQLEEATPSDDGRHDFDFLLGVAALYRRLRERLVGNTVWEQFAGTADFLRAIMGGLGNVDDNLLELPAGTYRAATLRVFDPVLKVPSIWWIDGRRPALDPPVHGRFEEGVGTFLGDDLLDGRPIRVRFIWSAVTARSARWEQAFSADSGAKLGRQLGYGVRAPALTDLLCCKRLSHLPCPPNRLGPARLGIARMVGQGHFSPPPFKLGSNEILERSARRTTMSKMSSVVHFEMPYDDRERMAKFYQSAFGWQTQMFGEEMGNYVLATTTETD